MDSNDCDEPKEPCLSILGGSTPLPISNNFWSGGTGTPPVPAEILYFTTGHYPFPPALAAAPAAQNDGRPSEAELGFPVYPSAVYLRSYDAGRGQKYHLFGSTVPFADLVAYYRNVLGEKGNLVFEVPPTYMFEMGRFREETMAFPPGVTSSC